MRLLFKDDRDRQVWPQLDYRLRRLIVPMLQHYARAHGFEDVTVTSIITGEHVSSTHEELRAVDIRLIPVGDTKLLEDFSIWINDCFSFLPGYNVALCGRTDPKGKHEDHLHLQVPRPYRPDGKISLVVN